MLDGKRGGSSDVVTRNFIIQLECKVSVGFKRATGGQTVPRSYFEAGLPCRTHFYPTQHCVSSLTRRISCAKPDARSSRELNWRQCELHTHRKKLLFHRCYFERVISYAKVSRQNSTIIIFLKRPFSLSITRGKHLLIRKRGM